MTVIFSLPCVSSSGQYVFDIMDTYGGGLGVLWVAIFETAVIMWIYGVGRFADDLTFMLNYKVSKVLPTIDYPHVSMPWLLKRIEVSCNFSNCNARVPESDSVKNIVLIYSC